MAYALLFAETDPSSVLDAVQRAVASSGCELVRSKERSLLAFDARRRGRTTSTALEIVAYGGAASVALFPLELLTDAVRAKVEARLGQIVWQEATVDDRGRVVTHAANDISTRGRGELDDQLFRRRARDALAALRNGPENEADVLRVVRPAPALPSTNARPRPRETPVASAPSSIGFKTATWLALLAGLVVLKVLMYSETPALALVLACVGVVLRLAYLGLQNPP